MPDKTLEKFIEENDPFVRLDDGEKVELVYIKYEVIASNFDPKKETVQYTFEDKDGNERYWTNGSNRVAKFLVGCKKGEAVAIHKEGEGRNSKYTLKKIEEDEKPAKKEESDEDVAAELAKGIKE